MKKNNNNKQRPHYLYDFITPDDRLQNQLKITRRQKVLRKLMAMFTCRQCRSNFISQYKVVA